MRFGTPRRSDEPELNLVPMIDVLLMTLIFLVMTTTFSKEVQLAIRLPESSAEAKVEESPLRITIDAQGQYFVNETQLLNDSPEVLMRAMSQAAGGKTDPVVVVYADGKTPHEAVVRAMDAARRLGYTHLTFATQHPPAK
jgi:biopolymer transport protein ExbD